MSSTANNEENCRFVNLNSSLDEFIRDYFGGTYVAKFDEERESETLDSSYSDGGIPMSNFSLGEDELMTSMSSLELTVTEDDESWNQENEDSKMDQFNESQTKIVCIKASRRSLSYDIIFNPLKNYKNAIQIRVKNSKNKESPSPSTSETKRMRMEVCNLQEKVAELEMEVSKLRSKNGQLEGQLLFLQQKLRGAEKIVEKLEIEVASFYS